jgi:hypothetical protein
VEVFGSCEDLATIAGTMRMDACRRSASMAVFHFNLGRMIGAHHSSKLGSMAVCQMCLESHNYRGGMA